MAIFLDDLEGVGLAGCGDAGALSGSAEGAGLAVGFLAAFAVLEEDVGLVAAEPVIWAVVVAEGEVLVGGCWGGRWKGRDGAELSVDVVDVVVELVCREVSEGC